MTSKGFTASSEAICLVLLGPPGAGKGTQAKVLARRTGLVHLSTGDLLRSAIQARTPIGLQLEALLSCGEFAPDGLVIDLVREGLRGALDQVGALLDGFPRNLPQAPILDKLLADLGLELGIAVYLDVPEAVLQERLSGRELCSICTAPYHPRLNPPARQGLCDLCGGKLLRRSDDHPQAIARRLELYAQETRPLLGYYQARGKLVRLDGDRPVPEVSARLEGILEGLRARRQV